MESIDAHVHIVPRELLGSHDERFDVTVLPFGVKSAPFGSIQFMPPCFEDSSFSAEALIATLDSAGVSRAIIMQSLCNASNEAVARAVAAHPGRLAGAMVIEPSGESCLDDIRRWHGRGLTVMKFETSAGLGYTHPNAYPDLRFDSPLFCRVFELAQSLGISVTIDPSRIGSQCYRPDILRKMALAFPALRFIICHLGFPYAGLRADAEKYALWRDMLRLAMLPNVWFDVAAMPDLFAEKGYPFSDATGFLREFLELFPGKAIWGSDIPGTLCSATYPQMADMFSCSGLFSETELESLFAGAARAAYSL